MRLPPKVLVLPGRTHSPFVVAGALRGGFYWGAAGGQCRREEPGKSERQRSAAERGGAARVLEKPERGVLADQVKSLDWKIRQAERIGKVSEAVVGEVLAKLMPLLQVQ